MRAYRGTLVSELAQAHDGRVWAESNGTGAAFIVEIPATHLDPASDAATS